MSDLHLPEHIHFCEIGEQRIFLDLVADRYFSLPPAVDASFSAIIEAKESAAASEVEALRRLGLLVAAPAGRRIEPTRHPVPDASLVEDVDLVGSPSLPILAEVLVLVVRARRAVRRKRLPAELALPDQRARRDRPGERRNRMVEAFLRTRRLVPIAPNCLYDSLALRHFLRRRGIEADLVIGTKLHPFAAHCWIQDETTVLNDSLASAHGFVPILVA